MKKKIAALAALTILGFIAGAGIQRPLPAWAGYPIEALKTLGNAIANGYITVTSTGNITTSGDFGVTTTDVTVIDLNTRHAKLALPYETTGPASGAACTKGEITTGKASGNFYIYICLQSTVWGRVQLTTGY